MVEESPSRVAHMHGNALMCRDEPPKWNSSLLDIIYSWPFNVGIMFPDICGGNATIEIQLQNNVSLVILDSVIISIKCISDSLSIDGPTIWVKDTQALFTIKGAMGTHWECQINWGDMTPISTVDNNMCDADASVNHTYTATGTFNVSTKCSNLLNTEDAQTQVSVDEPIQSVTIEASDGGIYVPAGIEVSFTVILYGVSSWRIQLCSNLYTKFYLETEAALWLDLKPRHSNRLLGKAMNLWTFR